MPEKQTRPEKGRSRRGKKRRNPGPQSFEARADEILDRLAGLARELWELKRQSQPEELVAPDLELELRIPLNRETCEAVTRGADILKKTMETMDAAFRPDGFQEGRVYCFLCQSFDCAHSIPHEAKAVFEGYSINGKPEWADFSNLLLQRNDPRVDLLYEKRAQVIARAEQGRDLHSSQLSGFGRNSMTHNILGQVVAGYFACSGNGNGSSQGRWAVSLQAVEYHSTGGLPRLGLNTISHVLGPEGLTGILTRLDEEELYSTIAKAKVKISNIGKSALNPRTGDWHSRHFEEKVWSVLQNLSRFLEKSSRHRHSRTRHAREDRARKDRPIAAALKDVRRAAPEAFLVDAESDAIVVIGPHRRTHVFNQDGKLITSINYEGDEIKRKVRTKRWRPARDSEIESFRQAVDSFRARPEPA